jgi:hypothetical protein
LVGVGVCVGVEVGVRVGVGVGVGVCVPVGVWVGVGAGVGVLVLVSVGVEVGVGVGVGVVALTVNVTAVPGPFPTPEIEGSPFMFAVYVPAMVPAGTVKATTQDFVSPALGVVVKLNEAGLVDTQLEGIGFVPVPATITEAVNEPLLLGAVTVWVKDTAGPPVVALRVIVFGE